MRDERKGESERKTRMITEFLPFSIFSTVECVYVHFFFFSFSLSLVFALKVKIISSFGSMTHWYAEQVFASHGFYHGIYFEWKKETKKNFTQKWPIRQFIVDRLAYCHIAFQMESNLQQKLCDGKLEIKKKKEKQISKEKFRILFFAWHFYHSNIPSFTNNRTRSFNDMARTDKRLLIYIPGSTFFFLIAI